MMIQKVDHFVITSKDMSATVTFYQKLGFRAENRGNRYELYAGDFKINVHYLGEELYPHAQNIRTGSSDFCLELKGDLVAFCKQLQEDGLMIEEGIVDRNGVRGPMESIYLRDPDGNLVEISSYDKEG